MRTISSTLHKYADYLLSIADWDKEREDHGLLKKKLKDFTWNRYDTNGTQVHVEIEPVLEGKDNEQKYDDGRTSKLIYGRWR